MPLPTSNGVRTGRPLQDVHVFGLQHRARSARNKRPWVVRWSLDGRQRSKAFRTKAEADRYRSLLVHAQSAGERFDAQVGEPMSWLPLPDDVQVHVWARRWLAEQWPEWQPRTRASALLALARFVVLLVPHDAARRPPGLRSHLMKTLPPGAATSGEETCERWLDRWCFTLSQLNRETLAEAERRLATGDDGQALAASTAARFRKNARACIRRAVELDVLAADPCPPAPKGRSKRKSGRIKHDIRTLPDPATMARAIEAIASHQPASRTYQVMTAVTYYAGLRPSEVVMLRRSALELPITGWGRIEVREADNGFDEPGEPKTGPRSVPIQPHLVGALRRWVDDHGLAPADYLFRTRTGKQPTASNWSRAWQRALREIGHGPLRVYDCRHATATTWLKAGVPLGEVARRLGHSVETLVSTYVGALAGDETLANERIDAFFAGNERA
jgi:integrase